MGCTGWQITQVHISSRADLGPAMTEETLDRMLQAAPVDGIECHYRTYTDRETTFYRQLAEERGLLIGTGQDPAEPPDASTTWPVDLKIDWVRAWRRL